MEIRPIFPAYIDSTMLSCFRSCKKKFYREFILGLRPARTSIHLHAGGAFATAIETVRREVFNHNQPLEAAQLTALRAYRKYWGKYSFMEGENKGFFNTWRGVDSYFERWDPRTDHLQPFRTGAGGTFEFSFAIPLEIRNPQTGDPLLFAGRIDMAASYCGLPTVVDEKTTVSLGPSFAHKWKLRGQFLGYCWAMQQMGIQCQQAVVRGTGLLKNEISHMEVLQTYNQGLIDRWAEEMHRTVELMTAVWEDSMSDTFEDREHEPWSYNFGEACEAYGGCAFADLCAGDPEHEPRWYTDYEVRRWNPLTRSAMEDDPEQPILNPEILEPVN